VTDHPEAESPGFTPGDGDDESDDPQLTSLRAVWLAMPDEEPPERGLADLMAAARVKAEEMARPSLWQRIAAVLRRPPVLALATVLVLVGGAVFIGQRRDKLEAPTPTVEQPNADTLQSERQRAAPVAAPTAAPAPTGEAPPPAEAAPSGATSATVGGTASAPGVGTVANPAAQPAAHAPARPKPAAPARRSAATDTRAIEKAAEKPADAKLEERAAPKPEPKTGAATRGMTMDLGGETDRDNAPEAAPQATAQALTEAPVNASQHVQQAKAAAARGDCATARKLMKRVASEDAVAYRKALASDAALTKCFEAR
jgi:hypothetical protein